MSEGVRVPWSEGAWTHPPVDAEERGEALVVTAVEGSDAWRETYYGFVHDSEHGLLAPFAVGTAMEVEFEAEFAEQFDQAGMFVRASADRWVKVGVEFADGLLQLGAVVTHGRSDWSVAPMPAWLGRRVLVRVSRGDDALIVRAAVDGGPLQFVRVIPFEASLEAQAGPLVAAPTRPGLTVRFLAWRRTPADVSLH
ncbi:DUF1349 domain-containing protein [Herbiconiux flava]|uniref:DUF1349 domain-containing protein n=1 Tax=Herbiconiux flava TaxID=881268 RepID=A0A852S995_9MICO|nr:DUF1349 domain-containing protein [Herbiconiux flava]NYD69808.1 hypothetical protein [Herbiconiux flava]GLK16556.1 hypothetical protein GCM10017602_10380 [Herbiconiux flava]